MGEVFKDCGEIKDIRMPLNEDQSHNRGFCHVEFVNAESVDKAMALVGQEVDGRLIRIDFSKSRQSRGGGGGGRGGFGGGQRGGSGCFKCGEEGHFSRECP